LDSREGEIDGYLTPDLYTKLFCPYLTSRRSAICQHITVGSRTLFVTWGIQTMTDVVRSGLEKAANQYREYLTES